jgi:tetratricopeptide (TPR) repeat protein
VQNAAYDTLLSGRRQQLHERIARALQQRWPETRATQPELLAHHFTEAAQLEEAVPLWQEAGELAMKRFALSEALEHLHKGLGLLGKQPKSPARDCAELKLRTALGPAVVARHGWAHSDVSEILIRAWNLAKTYEDRQSYLRILNSLWVHYLSVGKLQESQKWADELLEAGEQSGDDALVIVGHRAKSGSYYWVGELLEARRHGEIVHAMYSRERHGDIARRINTDPITGEGIYRSQYLWMLGYPDQARDASDAKDAHARDINHPYDLAFALTLGAQVFGFLSEPDELIRRTEEAERVARDGGVPLLSEVLARISRGIANVRAGRVQEGVADLQESLARLGETGHGVWIWYLRSVQAEGMAMLGDLKGALALIDASLARIEGGEDRVYYAEVLRVKGWVLMLEGEADAAERSLRAAIAIARSQHAKSWELRAATLLANLLADRGERDAAHALLAPVYEWFTEGFDTKDLKDARALLDILEPSVQGRTLDRYGETIQ